MCVILYSASTSHVLLLTCTAVSCSRLGIFDWILGRPEFNWKENFFRRFLREYTGMSLRGLQWTLPAGYILYLLGYGWQYSLSGSEMGAMYALGGLFGDVKIKNSPYWSTNLFGQIPTSEIIWGTTIWYFLIVTCLVELVKRRRATLDKRYRRIRIKLTSKLFLCCAHDCKNVLCLPHMYQVIVVTVVLITLCSAVYYVAIDQSDLLNKMQTFTGLFIGVVSLVLFLGCSWGYNYGMWIAKRKMKRSRNVHQRPARPHPRIQQPQNQENIEDYPLLPGSDSDDEGEKDPPRAAQYGAVVEEVVVANTDQMGGNVRAIGIRRHILGLQHMPQHELNVIRNEVTIIDYYWLLFETIFYLDIFAIFHCLGGLVAACTTVVTICATFVCLVWNIDTPRFLVDTTLLNNCTC